MRPETRCDPGGGGWGEGEGGGARVLETGANDGVGEGFPVSWVLGLFLWCVRAAYMCFSLALTLPLTR